MGFWKRQKIDEVEKIYSRQQIHTITENMVKNMPSSVLHEPDQLALFIVGYLVAQGYPTGLKNTIQKRILGNSVK